MICPRCGADASNGRKFCGDCGSPLPWRCAACGSENPPDKRFCSECGTAATAGAVEPGASSAPAPAASVAERRQLTVMFSDLVGSTALGTRLDPEDLRDVIAAYHGCVTGLAAKLGGFVARYMGDGVLVYFGYPKANEGDAEQAIRAGLAIVKAVSHLNTVAGPPGTLSARVGIATGLVIVGDLIGSGSSLESAVVGETPNLAARLQAMTEPGTVVIADSTRNLTGGLFEYRDLGPASLKGLGSIRPWAVLGEKAIDSRFEALRSSQASLVGREEELALLLRRWQQAKSGDGRVVLLSGEPGIGKSRLIAALEQSLSNAPPERLRFVCSPHYQDAPLHPIIRQFERSARFQNDDPPVAKRDKLRRLLGRGARDADIALLGDLLSIPGAAEDLPRTLTPRHQKEMTFAAILRYLAAFARRTPLLAVLEDIHWADPTTRELLDAQIEAVERLPMLLIITTRPEPPPSWATHPVVTVQMLGGLHHRQAASLINEVTGDQALPPDVVERIITHADGVPLFIEELTKTVVEKGLLRKDGERLLPAEPLSVDVVPTSLQASLMARLDRLAAGKEVAQVGSVIGRDFSFEMLLAVSAVPAKRLEDALGQLVETGLATARGQPPEASYSFKHALVQDAAYASMLRDRRRELHLRLGETLEKNSANGATTDPQLIAWHFSEAGAPDRSIDYYLKAAERATGRFALNEMVSHLRKGLRQHEFLPESPSRLRRELDLQVALGRALIDHQGSGSEEVRAAFERAREICLELEDTRQLLVVFDGLVLNYHFTHSDSEKMLGYAEELFEVGRRTGNALALLWARRCRSAANWLQGRFEQARHDMQLVINMYESRQDGFEDRWMARDPKVSTYTALGICLTALGYPDASATMTLEGVRHAESRNHVVSLILGLRRACVRGMMLRDTHGVLDLSDRLLVLNTEHETFVGVRESAIFHGWAQLHGRRDPALLKRVQTSLEQLDASKHWVLLPFFMTSVAEVMGENRDHAGAAALLDRAAELVSLTGEQWCEAEILRLKARFGARDPDAAVALLQASLAKAREQGAKIWELRTATTLAEVLRAQGNLAAAREVLAPVYAWFTEGFNAPDLVAARALLADLGRQPSASSSG
jgi:class 3 adenylate cyclase